MFELKSFVRIFIGFILILIYTFIGLQTSTLNASVLKIKSSKKELLLKINLLDEVKIVNKNIDGKIYKKIGFTKEAENISSLGTFPEIEYLSKVIFFAVPKGSIPTYQILNKSSELSFERRSLIPSQKLVHGKENGIDYFYDYVHTNETIVNDEKKVIELVKLGIENGLYLYKLEFYPLRFNNDHANLITEIDVMVSYKTSEFKKDTEFKTDNVYNKNNNIKSNVRKPLFNSPRKVKNPRNFFENSIVNFDIASENRHTINNRSLKPTFLDLKTRWIKMSLTQSGIYKVTGTELLELDENIDLNSINLDYISVFSSAGEDLDPNIHEIDEIFHGAKEITRRVIDINGNDIFDEEDYILFYANGISGWMREKEIKHYYNRYNSEVYYWIELGVDSFTNGKNMGTLFEENLNGEIEIDNFNRFLFIDDRIEYLYIHERAHWFTNEIITNENKFFTFNLDEISSPSVEIFIHNDSSMRNEFKNNETIEYLANNDNSTSLISSSYLQPLEYSLASNIFNEYSSNNFSMKNLNLLSINQSKYLWGYEVQYKGKLNPILMTDYNFSFEPENEGNFKLNIINGDDYDIYDITDPVNVTYSIYSDANNNSFFLSDSLINEIDFKYYYISNSNGENYLTIPHMDIYDNSSKETLHSLSENIDMLIITPNIFMDYMESEDGGQRLIDAHLSVNDTATFTYGNIKVINIEDINLEFGRGYQEPTATRNFIKYAYSNWNTKYILLIGDGTYDYRNIENFADKNFIYPSDITDTYYIGSDQFYSELNSEHHKQVAIGRFPVDNPNELEDLIQKTIDYIKNPIYSKIRSTVLLVADDERNPDKSFLHRIWGETLHIDNMEDYIVPVFPDNYLLKKVYLTEYPFEVDAATSRLYKPKASEDIVRKLNQGTSIFLYVGHGSPSQFSHEVAFNSTYFQKVNNFNKYFLQMGAACSTGLFDNPLSTGFTEEMIKAKNRGSIAGINNTRKSYSNSNENFFRRVLMSIFFDENYKISIGEALRIGHNLSSTSNNIIGYMLVGDPAVRIFRDYEEVSVPESEILELTTLLLDTVVVNILDNDTINIGNIDATLEMIINDSERSIKYFNEDYWHEANMPDTLIYLLPGNQIVSTRSSIRNSTGIARFVLPKDVLYGNDKGKINFYAFNTDENIELTGSVSNISIKADTIGLSDEIPPNINILFNDFNYKAGDPIPSDAIVIIELSDENGINTTGGIGHNLIMEIDGEETVLNNYFSYFLDSYQAGFCSYQVFDLSEGRHSIKVSAWDTFNNYNEKIISFTVSNTSDNGDNSIGNILNYPNPINNSNGTNFTFTTIEPTLLENIKISVFTINGRKVNVIDDEAVINTTSNFQNVFWNGKDFDGDNLSNGVYFYKIELKYSNGNKTKGIGKLFFAK